ncbi:Flp family type IVb pilin [Nitrospira sp. MA-1]|nr:Flp family type IVb pilin [Nitrospira sp. MA-1]
MGNFFSNDQGTAAIEYSLLLSLIGMAVIGSLQLLGTNVFDGISTLNQVFVSTQLKDDSLPHP